MLHAIDTSYKGYLFRSRLEARWAVFLDRMGVRWEYEKEGYNLDGDYYLPDFWLPDWNCWLEIKPDEPTEHEITVGKKLCETSKFCIVFAIGLPSSEFGSIKVFCPNDAGVEMIDLEECCFLAVDIRSPNPLCIIGEEEKIFLTCLYGYRLYFLSSEEFQDNGCSVSGVYTDYRPLNDQELSYARCCRFEHGETPASMTAKQAAAQIRQIRLAASKPPKECFDALKQW